MLTWVLSGFLLGLQHAIEADHIAAVTALSVEKRGMGRIISHGAIWGIGHAIILGGFGGIIHALEITLNERLAVSLECMVGFMMVLLGGRLIALLFRERVHFHTHQHIGGRTHFHAHSHAGETIDHASSRHDHFHPSGGWKQSLTVGMMHGLAGSSVVVALAASATPSVPVGVMFMTLFGLGSMVGMAIFSTVIAIPLSYAPATLTWLTRSIQGLAGICSVGIGIHILIDTGSRLFLAR